MITSLLDDLLPSFFDLAVVRLTQRRLLPVERTAILTALVNGIGESVMRRARDTRSEESYVKDITEISTADRFSDEWISRVEIIDGIEHSSGLDRTLSELALLLIENQLDSILRLNDEDTSVVGIGQITPTRRGYEERFRTRDMYERAYEEFIWRMRFPSWFERLQILLQGEQDYPVRSLIQQMQAVAALREPMPFKIGLSDSLAFKKDSRFPRDMHVERSTENRFEVKPF